MAQVIYCYRIADSHGAVCEVAARDLSDIVEVSGMRDTEGRPLPFVEEACFLPDWANDNALDLKTNVVELDLDARRLVGWGIHYNKLPNWLRDKHETGSNRL